ncbi:hypothetical protein Misp01_31490 [Microtetraspora sp. NBRC 13810]|uniref:general stress protein n=1 Tax=Microtetraspora sp. NBRC 13810 TaxID=3030990 RepID=UPI0024A2328F|nr:general stress protein [Microtetraspora sp. NBRC 13810]GLW08019.1 hypothetical protein Misp01_31490 [Microtetraspora sp. NBRC 13810]
MTDPTVGLGTPVNVDRRLLVSHTDYVSAQRTVDALSDAGFPVEQVSIVGRDLRLEEVVTGRVTNATAALRGAGNGVVFGLVIGLFLGLFTSTTASFIALVLWAALWGAALGAAFGFANHYFTRGQRDFASRSALVAGRYDVMVATTHLERARATLDGLSRPGEAGSYDTAVVEPPPSAGTYPGQREQHDPYGQTPAAPRPMPAPEQGHTMPDAYGRNHRR